MKKKHLFIVLASSLLAVHSLSFGQAPNLGTASSFALFTAGGALTNSGASTVVGDIGTNAGAFSGFNTATVTGQTRLAGSPEAAQAALDVTAAYNALTTAPCSTTPIGPLLGNGQVITPGVYCQNTPAAAATLNGTLTLSGAGIYIIKLNDALTTATGSIINLTNGACADNVYFQVNGAVDVGVGSVFRGTILANGAISLLTGASLEGRALSIAGAISLNANTVTVSPSTLSLNAVAGSCNAATNQYVLSGTISLTNSPAGTIVLTDGSTTTTVSVTAGQASASFSLSALDAGTGTHAVTATGLVCSPVALTYTAPASCTSASLGGLVFSDANGDGLQDGGDTPLSGVAVTLLNSTNIPIAFTTTSPSGLYSFTGLAAGTPYSVSFTTPASYTATGANVGGIAGPVSLTPGENNTSLGASYQPIAVSVSPALAISVTAAISQTATNQYTLTGVISLTAGPAGTLLITDGTTTTTVSVTAGQTTVGYSLSGLTAGATSHTVTVSGAGYPPASATYIAPAPVGPVNPLLSVQAYVNNSIAQPGDILTYTLVLTNSGSTSATTTVRDSISAGGTYVPGSATVPIGTSFVGGQPIGQWVVPSIGAGQSLTLTFQVRADAGGILYNTVTIPGDTVKVCTSIPVKMCVGDEYTITAPAGRSSYQWYRNNQLIANQTTNVLVVSEPGTYSLGVDNTGGLCPDFSCCPFILELDTLPSYQAATIAATCVGNSPQANAQLVLSGFNPGHTYQYSLGTTFDSTASLSGVAQVIPANGVIAATLPNPAVTQFYTVRVYNRSGCYTDTTVMLMPTVCGCPVDICVPYVLTQTKRSTRIGAPVR